VERNLAQGSSAAFEHARDEDVRYERPEHVAQRTAERHRTDEPLVLGVRRDMDLASPRDDSHAEDAIVDDPSDERAHRCRRQD